MAVIRLIISIVVCQAAGAVGALFTGRSVSTWYATINKPSFTPPSWVFGPVWISLYLMMGFALFLVWNRGISSEGVRLAVCLFAIQLFLNAAWSPAFFGMQSPAIGLVVIILLLVAIIATVVAFVRISFPAALLMIPYLLWVSYATILNAAIVYLN